MVTVNVIDVGVVATGSTTWVMALPPQVGVRVTVGRLEPNPVPLIVTCCGEVIVTA